MEAMIITPEQASNFAAKHSLPQHKENIYCSHDSRSHEVLVPAPLVNENDYQVGLIKICRYCNREVESDFLMKDVIPKSQIPYHEKMKGLTRIPGISPKSKRIPDWFKQPTAVHIKKPFIF